MTIKPSEDEWLDVDVVSEITGLAKGTIYNRNSKGGDVPVAYKFGQGLRFRRSDLDAWLEAHRCVPASAQLTEKQSA
jgi:predicted DNA-binding transcriptional regulator AlpA